MRLKAKNLRWSAGRPIVVITARTAQKLSVNPNDRIVIKNGSKKVYGIVDFFSGIITDKELGLSEETQKILDIKSGSLIDVSKADLTEGGRIIRKKMSGKELSKKEISQIIEEITSGNLTEPEIAYFISAEKLVGMSSKEIVHLTEAMINNGQRLKFNKKIVSDKHCIGGIAGNRTTPIVVSICAAAGLIIPKNSSRAITSAAGTADVVETIANVELKLADVKRIVTKNNGCLVWNGVLGLSPSDDKIIRIERLLNLDVESQLLASIVSKKIATGSNHILTDIPYGGGKMKTKKEAVKLGKRFLELSKHFKIKLKPVYTLGNQPIGNGVGPVLEMLDVISVLQNQKDAPKDLRKKSLYLATELMKLSGVKNPKQKARKILDSGLAYKKFEEIINSQNKKSDFPKRVASLKTAKYSKTIFAQKNGRIKEISNKNVNSVARILGTPEEKSAGIYLHKHLGRVKKKEKLMTLYADNKKSLKEALDFMKEFPAMEIK